ncbi:MAG: MFS transporter [Muribaculaceae bacterium]|nr:MFS transporter [Muribaculaceae bacterium]
MEKKQKHTPDTRAMEPARKAGPIAWVPTAYFAMGLPFVVLNMVTVLMFSGMGVDDALIAFWTSLILLPWTLKPLWSPFMELFGSKKFYVVATQVITGAAFGLVALSLTSGHFFAAAIAFLAVAAFSGATHDVACDGVYLSELSVTEQARYIGWQGAFYNIAKIAATGGLVYLSGYLIASFLPSAGSTLEANRKAWIIIMGLLSALMVLLAVWHIFMLPGGRKTSESRPAQKRTGAEVMRELWAVLRDFFTKKYIWIYIAFIILYRFGEGFVVKIVPLFLQASRESGGLGLDNQQIGIYYGTCGAAAFVAGSLLAGYYISARGLRRTLFTLCCCFNIPFAVYALLAFFQPQQGWLIASGIVLEYFGYGFGFVGLTLFMMQQVAPGRHRMAHYAFASGIMNLGVMIPGMMSGWISDRLGYSLFFIFVLVACVPAFIITRLVPFRFDDKGNPLQTEEAELMDGEGIDFPKQ